MSTEYIVLRHQRRVLFLLNNKQMESFQVNQILSLQCLTACSDVVLLSKYNDKTQQEKTSHKNK